MNRQLQQTSLFLTGAVFFAIVAPLVAVVVPILPLMALAYAGIDNPWMPLILTFAFGGAPAFLAGMLYVLIGSWLLRTKRIDVRRMPAVGSALCMLCFIAWFAGGSVLNAAAKSFRDFVLVLGAAVLLSVFAGVGGYLTSRGFLVIIRRIGVWGNTTLGAHARNA